MLLRERPSAAAARSRAANVVAGNRIETGDKFICSISSSMTILPRINLQRTYAKRRRRQIEESNQKGLGDTPCNALGNNHGKLTRERDSIDQNELANRFASIDPI
jgi:hypothetical protein